MWAIYGLGTNAFRKWLICHDGGMTQPFVGSFVRVNGINTGARTVLPIASTDDERRTPGVSLEHLPSCIASTERRHEKAIKRDPGD